MVKKSGLTKFQWLKIRRQNSRLGNGIRHQKVVVDKIPVTLNPETKIGSEIKQITFVRDFWSKSEGLQKSNNRTNESENRVYKNKRGHPRGCLNFVYCIFDPLKKCLGVIKIWESGGAWLRPYQEENTTSRPISEVKPLRARLVLGLETTREHRVSQSFFVNPYFYFVNHYFWHQNIFVSAIFATKYFCLSIF